MKRIFILLMFCLSGCTDPKNYKANVLELGLGFSAQSLCSCLWVVGHNEANCREFVQLEQVSPRFQIDHDQRRVRAISLLVFTREAEFLSERRGCRLR